jgi:hypothetical protein
MSDNLKRYRAIKDALRQFYPREAKGHLAQHLNCLAALVSGIVGSKQSQLPLIASKIPGASQPASRAKTCSRWINAERNDYETYFLPFAQELLRQLSQTTLVLIMDSSEVGRKCMTLMVSAVHRGRALPLAWVVYRGNKGHLPEGTHIGLLESVLEILPPASDVVVLGDGEFDGPGLLATIEQLGARYVCRTAQNALLTGEDEVLSFAEVGVQRGQQIALPGVRFTHRCYGPLLAIAWWHTDYCEPLYLVSNFDLTEEACYYYAKRFHIETFFSDQKSRGFNLHKSHLSDPMRLARLMIATCLAYIWIVYLGIIAIADGWQGFIHRADRCDLSLFQLGLRLLDHFLETAADIPVAFQIE